MINNYLYRQIKEIFRFQPTFQQELVIKLFSNWIPSLQLTHHQLLILRGYAGVGKTSLVGALVKSLSQNKIKTVLLAPTGRAAKVFSDYANHQAFTIHKKIYRQKKFTGASDEFSIDKNLSKETLFIVDEASMISNVPNYSSPFGSGRLLDDLVQYVYSGERCNLLLIGDTAQLPPVGESHSPALSRDVMQGYGLEVKDVELTEVVRQVQDSGILHNATQIREAIMDERYELLPKLVIHQFADVELVKGEDLLEVISGCYDADGIDETLIVCRSNKRANLFNKGIRAQILWREDELNTGDILMVTKNNYFWSESYKELDFVANGERVEVKRLYGTKELYGFRFQEATLELPDYDHLEIDATLLLDTLHYDAPSLPKEQSRLLFDGVLADYADVSTQPERMKKVKSDPYYNALQIKYAYAITCHKAQGGQWKNVFIDQAYSSGEYLTPDYFRWLYTAFTRATSKLYLINYPQDQVD